MSRFVFAVLAGIAVIAAAVTVPTRAGAVTMTAPTGLAAAIGETSATEHVRLHHRHYWWRWHWPWWGWHRPHWRHHWWWGFPFIGPSWHSYPHRRHHPHRAHQRPQQKQEGQGDQKQEDQKEQK